MINLAYLGEQIRAVLGNGQDFGLNITYSLEIDGGLETGGGILQALPLLGPEPFMTINADILTNFDFSALRQPLPPSILANVILISDKNNRPEGDFSLNETLLSNAFPRPYTAAGITIYRSEFFDGLTPGKFSVAPLWRRFADEGRVIGTVFEGKWNEVGNMEQLEKLR